jgi:hypothetical protein
MVPWMLYLVKQQFNYWLSLEFEPAIICMAGERFTAVDFVRNRTTGIKWVKIVGKIKNK